MDMIEFFANEYKEEKWNKYAACFKELNISVEGVPQDVINAVLTVLGEESGYDWLYIPLHQFNGRCAIDLLKIPNGEKALKAFIMRLPT